MMVKQMVLIILLALILLGCSGSGELTYNKGFLNDIDMDLGTTAIQSTEISSATYREAASGATDGGVGGGCGCN